MTLKIHYLKHFPEFIQKNTNHYGFKHITLVQTWEN